MPPDRTPLLREQNTCPACSGKGQTIYYGTGTYAELRSCSTCGTGEKIADTVIPNAATLAGAVTDAGDTHGQGVAGGSGAPEPCPTCGMPPRVESPDAQAKTEEDSP